MTERSVQRNQKSIAHYSGARRLKENVKYRMALLIWATIIFSISPAITKPLDVNGNLLFLIGCGIIVAYFINSLNRRVHASIKLALLPFVLALPSSLYWQDPQLTLFPIYLFLSIIVIFLMDDEITRNFARIATISLIVISGGAWIGFIYALLGGESKFSIINSDGRLNNFYLTTFSNWSIGNFIRPSGIFDEPGTLSFLICLVCALRGRLGESKGPTWALLTLGLITSSLAHMVYMAFHSLEDRSFIYAKKYILCIPFIAAVVCVVGLNTSDSLEAEVFVSRFVVEDGKLGGDSRSDLFASALNRIDGSTFLFGLDSDCITRPAVCESKGYGQFGETPAGILLLLGFILSSPYFALLLYCSYISLRQTSFIYIGLLMLLMQRPFLFLYGHSLLILIAVAFKKPGMSHLRWIWHAGNFQRGARQTDTSPRK